MKEMKIGIIGSAGRKEDKEKWNKNKYINAVYNTKTIIDNIQSKYLDTDISLVSGGAAWADHIAVSLFLMDKVDRLILHLPSEWNFNNKCFLNNSTANYYHSLFSKKVGANTLEGIQKAIEKGAMYTFSEGFKERNLLIANDSDVLIAYTFNKGKLLKPNSGTLHTWNNSNAWLKIHKDLNEI